MLVDYTEIRMQDPLLDIMRRGVHNGKEEHAVGALPMEPLALVERDPSNLGAKPGYNVPAHWEHDQPSVKSQ